MTRLTYILLCLVERRLEVLANFVFRDPELGGDFILHDSVFEGSSGDHERDLLVAA